MALDILKIIKYEGGPDQIVWKHPAEDFNTGSQLIVHESQEALFFKNGQALDLFGPGRYTLSTQNIPLLSKLINLPTGGESPFHCEVYFINKADILEVFWGTPNTLPVQDPVYQVIFPIRARGQMALRIFDSASLVTKMVGTTDGLNKEQAAGKLRAYLIGHVKQMISEYMNGNKITIFDINTRLVEISEQLWVKARQLYQEYGMDVVNFIVEDISVPEDDPNYRELQKALSQANSEAVKMQRLGYSYQEKRTYDILQDAAQNEGTSSELMGAGMGMGMGLNIGGIFGGAMGGAMQQMNPGMWQGGYGYPGYGPMGYGQAGYGQPGYGQPGMAGNQGQPGAGPGMYGQPGAMAGAGFGQQPMGNGGAAGNQGVQSQEVQPQGVQSQAAQPEASAGSAFCPECGGKIQPGAKFCMNCGAKLEVQEQPVCPSCHAPVQPGAKFCMNCGTKLG